MGTTKENERILAAAQLAADQKRKDAVQAEFDKAIADGAFDKAKVLKSEIAKLNRRVAVRSRKKNQA